MCIRDRCVCVCVCVWLCNSLITVLVMEWWEGIKAAALGRKTKKTDDSGELFGPASLADRGQNSSSINIGVSELCRSTRAPLRQALGLHSVLRLRDRLTNRQTDRQTKRMYTDRESNR